MFIGHYAIGMLGKKYAPQLSLGTLFLSVQLADMLWPIFLLAGLEHVKIEPGNTAFTPLNMVSYPITHSLLGGVIWGGIFALIYYMVKKVKRPAMVVGIGVVSHWFLDLLMHRPDLPIYPGGAKYGFGLWNSVPGTFVVELTLFAFGIYTYIKLTKPNDKTGNWSFWGLIVFLLLAWLSSVFGPPPPSVNVLAVSALLLWLLVPWGYWIDKHRSIR